LRVILDEHYSPAVAVQLRKRGHDVVAAVEIAEIKNRDDLEVFRWAISQHRAVITENAVDFIPLHAQYLSRGDRHFGIVLTSARRFPRRRAGTGRLVPALNDLLERSPHEDALTSDLRWLLDSGQEEA
jgi:Domain of unknown function (DUF5615)